MDLQRLGDRRGGDLTRPTSSIQWALNLPANDITGTTPASFEPTIDYVVTKMPRFAFEKFPGAEALLTTSMKSVGEAMSIGRTFQESLQKALRSMETGLTGLNEIEIKGAPDKGAIVGALSRPTPDRILVIAQAFRHGKRIMVHLKVNTGLNRLGMDEKDFCAMMEAIQSSAYVQLEGIFSHFASSEIVDSPQCSIQLSRFHGFLEKLAQSGVHPALQHMANSSAIPSRPESWFNMVRPGISLYGYYLPFTSSIAGVLPFALPVSPVLAWKTRVIHTRIVEAGQRVGYGGAHVTRVPAKVAVLSVGYCDGLGRHLSSRGRVIVHDRYAPIIGNISMNLTTIDVTGIPDVEVGDEAILIGRAGNIEITAWEHARLGSTIPYEVLCSISSRVPRTYIG